MHSPNHSIYNSFRRNHDDSFDSNVIPSSREPVLHPNLGSESHQVRFNFDQSSMVPSPEVKSSRLHRQSGISEVESDKVDPKVECTSKREMKAKAKVNKALSQV